jgi:predicted ArsR family transcriptional regulator
MSEQNPEPRFGDVNAAVGEEWESETTPFERVRTVVKHAYSPVAVQTVAENTRTTPKTAQKHLATLASDGFLETEPGERGGTLYQRSGESLVLAEASAILEQVSVAELVDQVGAMRAKIRDYQERYGVELPTGVTVTKTNALLSGLDSTAPDLDSDTIREWQTTRRNLAFANVALSIANAKTFVGGGTPDLDNTDPAK